MKYKHYPKWVPVDGNESAYLVMKKPMEDKYEQSL